MSLEKPLTRYRMPFKALKNLVLFFRVISVYIRFAAQFAVHKHRHHHCQHLLIIILDIFIILSVIAIAIVISMVIFAILSVPKLELNV